MVTVAELMLSVSAPWLSDVVASTIVKLFVPKVARGSLADTETVDKAQQSAAKRLDRKAIFTGQNLGDFFLLATHLMPVD